jgi:hypothetical protein
MMAVMLPTGETSLKLLSVWQLISKRVLCATRQKRLILFPGNFR